ncbi:MAG: ABC-2 family transporter protein [Treponema sp.]|nr:ABC-2 family transporter protein [Treponema sp.]
MNLKKYLALTRVGMMEKLHYRLGTFVTLFGNLIYLVLIYFLWKAIYASSGSDVVNGMTLNDTLVYLVLATALFNFLEVFLVWDMSREIQSGSIVLKLLKPMNFRSYSFWSYIGENIMSFILTFLPTFIIINILTNGSIALGINLLFFAVSVIMALILNFSIDMIVATICLYTESTWGLNMVKECIVLLLSGASIPLAFFPEALRKIVHFLPFRCIYDTPLNVLLQKQGYTLGTGIGLTLGLQLVWCIALTALGCVFWNFSLKKITVNGG